MCGSPDNDAAEQARRRERERQAKIKRGRNRINAQFEQFDDDYYSGLREDYTGYYMPKIEDQYKDAHEQSVFGLSRSGNLNSSAGAEQMGELEEAYAKQRANYADKAQGFVNDARGRVQDTKQNLYSQLQASADPAAAAQAANARASQLSQPPQFSPIGNLFGQFLNTGAMAVDAERKGFRGADLGMRPPKLRQSERVIR